MAVNPPQRRQPRYTYAIVDVVTGRLLAEHIPLTMDRYERLLGGDGEATGSIKLRDPRMASVDFWGTTTPGRSELWVLRDGQPVWDGVIWSRRYTAQTGVATISASESVRWQLERRHLRPDEPGESKILEFDDVDQFEIFRELIRDSESVEIDGYHPARLRLDMGTEESGVTRDRHISGDGDDESDSAYHGYDFADYMKRLDELAELTNGFEFRFDPVIRNGEYRRRLVLGHPRVGRAPREDTHVLEFPGEILGYDLDEDASETATYVAALGSGEESELRWSYATDEGAIFGGWPLLENTTESKDTSSRDTLDDQAEASLDRRRGPAEIPEIELVGRPPVSPGDYVRLRIDDWARFGDQIYEEYVRVIGMKVTPEPVEKTTLQLEEER